MAAPAPDPRRPFQAALAKEVRDAITHADSLTSLTARIEHYGRAVMLGGRLLDTLELAPPTERNEYQRVVRQFVHAACKRTSALIFPLLVKQVRPVEDVVKGEDEVAVRKTGRGETDPAFDKAWAEFAGMMPGRVTPEDPWANEHHTRWESEPDHGEYWPE